MENSDPDTNGSPPGNSEKSEKRKRLSLWQWLKENDIFILIVVGVITVACLRFATHLEKHQIHPRVSKVIGYLKPQFDSNHFESNDDAGYKPETKRVSKQMSKHISEQNSQQNSEPTKSHSTWLAFLELAIILIVLWVIVEVLIRPELPISHYLLPDAVTEIRLEKAKNAQQQQFNTIDSLFSPPKLKPHTNPYTYPF